MTAAGGVMGQAVQPQQEIISPKVTRWTEQISSAWTTGVKGILYTAMLMGEARGDCTDEEWRQVVEELPFGIRHAQMLIKIGLDPRLTRHVSLMPSDIRTMYQLTRLSIPRYDELLESGVRRFEKRGIFQRQSHAWWLWVSSAVVD